MSLQSNSALLNLRLRTGAEDKAQRQHRVSRSIQVARQMLQNGCSTNAVTRYTGLTEDELRTV